MSGWTYFDHDGQQLTQQQYEQAIAGDATGRVTVGKRELELLLRARRASSHAIVIPHTRNHNATRMAARRLAERELFMEPHAFGGPGVGWLYRYNLTERGRTCWLRVREGAK